MALSPNIVWEVRTDGLDLNGGGFNPVLLGGVDYSQQPSAEHVYTDLTIGPTANQISSIIRPFIAPDRGNLIRISSGTGFTPGVYEIIFVSGGIATLDRSVGTIGSSSGEGRLGGALQTLRRASLDYVAGNWIWVRGGTYPITGSVDFDTFGSSSALVKVVGYGIVRGDGGFPVLSANNFFGTVIRINASYFLVQNLEIDGNFDAYTGIELSAGNQYLSRIIVRNTFGIGIMATFVDAGHIFRCSVIGVSGETFGYFAGGFRITTNTDDTLLIEQCLAYKCGVPGFYIDAGNVLVYRCISALNESTIDTPGDGIVFGNTFALPWIKNCTIYGNGGSGIRSLGIPISRGGSISNCIIENNQKYGIENLHQNNVSFIPMHPSYRVLLEKNAYFSNGLGIVSRVISGATDIELTSTAFMDPDSGDFRLNKLPGGGLLCRNNGNPGTFSFLPNTRGFADIGAIPACGGTELEDV